MPDSAAGGRGPSTSTVQDSPWVRTTTALVDPVAKTRPGVITLLWNQLKAGISPKLETPQFKHPTLPCAW
eukprot:6618572-Alexandrium_andersonii.AAC.1